MEEWKGCLSKSRAEMEIGKYCFGNFNKVYTSLSTSQRDWFDDFKNKFSQCEQPKCKTTLSINSCIEYSVSKKEQNKQYFEVLLNKDRPT